MTDEEAEINAQSKIMACTKLVENNPDEFERYHIKFLKYLRDKLRRQKNGKGRNEKDY